jgi:hypothetical protein
VEVNQVLSLGLVGVWAVAQAAGLAAAVAEALAVLNQHPAEVLAGVAEAAEVEAHQVPNRIPSWNLTRFLFSIQTSCPSMFAKGLMKSQNQWQPGAQAVTLSIQKSSGWPTLTAML